MLKSEHRQTLYQLAREAGIEPAALLAVVEVESGGIHAVVVDGKPEPPIRFEGHYFYRLLPRMRRNRAVAAGLAHPLAGRIANPASQAGRWKLLRKACDIDRPAALAATSWGIGQVMGDHWRWLDYGSLDALVDDVRTGLEGQVRLMLRFIDKAGLRPFLLDHDWQGFARAYNGPGYASHRYDDRLAAAFVAHGGRRYSIGRHDPAILDFGSRGAQVEELQHNLRQLGYPLIADGDFGRATQAALMAFQVRHGLVADGRFGPKTLAVAQRLLPPVPLREKLL